MIVFHGTGDYCLDGIVRDGLIKTHHHISKPCACTSLSFQIAQLFAIRKTPSDDFMAGKISGIVLEFDMTGRQGKDYQHVRDSRCIQDEQEIAIFSPRLLQLKAIWRHNENWNRFNLDDKMNLSDDEYHALLKLTASIQTIQQELNSTRNMAFVEYFCSHVLTRDLIDVEDAFKIQLRDEKI